MGAFGLVLLILGLAAAAVGLVMTAVKLKGKTVLTTKDVKDVRTYQYIVMGGVGVMVLGGGVAAAHKARHF